MRLDGFTIGFIEKLAFAPLFAKMVKNLGGRVTAHTTYDTLKHGVENAKTQETPEDENYKTNVVLKQRIQDIDPEMYQRLESAGLIPQIEEAFESVPSPGD